MKFKYIACLKKGYRPVMEIEEETETSFIIEAENRVTADRIVEAMLKDAPNIKECSGFCIRD